jgi:subtilisin family serine protease
MLYLPRVGFDLCWERVALKKAVTVVLVAIMLMGTIGGVLLFIIPRRPASTDPFEDVPDPNIKSYRYADFSGMDLTELDLSGAGDDYLTFTYDSATKWPPAEKMPQGFSPEEMLEMGKNLGLGLKALHESGITGEGVSVAVIDKPILKDHEAYADNIEYIEVKPGDEKMSRTHFHGAACASILSGTYGVAPGSKLYYFAVPDDGEPYTRYAEAMDMLLEIQAGLPEDGKIRVVSVSHGIDPQGPGASAWASAIKKAEEQGIIVVYPGMPGLSFTGAGALPGKDRDDPASYQMWSWTLAKQQIAGKLESSGATTFEAAREELKKMLTSDPELDWLQADAITTFIYMMEIAKQDETVTYDTYLWSMTAGVSGMVAVPADFVTVANNSSPTSYTYYGAGGLSWATPYLAGMMALGLQVNPSATAEEIYDAIRSTATPLWQIGLWGDLVSPGAFVDAMR